MKGKIRIGIAGARGLSYCKGFLSMPDVEITALCDSNEKILNSNADQYNIKQRYRVFDDLCDSDVDAIFVSTPMNLHVPQSIQALQSGKNVLSEVTAGISLHELYCLKNAVESSNQVYMMSENFCYRPDVVLVRKMVEEGRFGEIYYAETDHIEDMKFFCKSQDGKKLWRSFWQLGKHGAYYPTHALGPVMKWFGDDAIDEISTFGVRPYLYKDIPQEATTTTIIRTKKNRMIKLRVDAVSNRPTQISYYGLQGVKGTLESYRGNPEKQDGAYIYFNDGKVRFKEKHKWQDLSEYYEELDNAYKEKLAENLSFFEIGDYFCARDFIRAVRGEIDSPINIYDACEWTAVALLSEISVQNKGKTIKMPDFRGKSEDYRLLI